MLRKQRDMYQYLHDQTLRLANQGETMLEIAEQVELPPALAKEWYSRGYYGTVSHNSKAVYQKYLGWYDANPANLNPLPPAESAQRALEYMLAMAYVRGGKIRERAIAGWLKSPGRSAEPTNMCCALAADANEQLGYCESGIWRNAYLMAAQELRRVRRSCRPLQPPAWT